MFKWRNKTIFIVSVHLFALTAIRSPNIVVQGQNYRYIFKKTPTPSWALSHNATADQKPTADELTNNFSAFRRIEQLSSTTAVPSLLALLSGKSAAPSFNLPPSRSSASAAVVVNSRPPPKPRRVKITYNQAQTTSTSAPRVLQTPTTTNFQPQIQQNRPGVTTRKRIERAVAYRLCRPTNAIAARARLSHALRINQPTNSGDNDDGWYVADPASGCATFAFCRYDGSGASLYTCPPGTLFDVENIFIVESGFGSGGTCERAELVQCLESTRADFTGIENRRRPQGRSWFGAAPAPRNQRRRQGRNTVIWRSPILQPRSASTPTWRHHLHQPNIRPSYTSSIPNNRTNINMEKLMERLQMVEFFQPLQHRPPPVSVQLAQPDVNFVAIERIANVEQNNQTEPDSNEEEDIEPVTQQKIQQQQQNNPAQRPPIMQKGRTPNNRTQKSQTRQQQPAVNAAPRRQGQQQSASGRQNLRRTAATTRSPRRPPTTQSTALARRPATPAFRCPLQQRGFFAASNANCTRYYFCDPQNITTNATSAMIELRCPTGLLFNSAIGGCDLPQNSDCSQFLLSATDTGMQESSSSSEDVAGSAEKTLTESTAILPGNPIARSADSASGRRPVGAFWRSQLPTAPGVGSLAQDDCPFPLPGMYPIDRCQAFVQCTYDLRAFYVQCPQQLLFSERLQSCDWFYNVRCTKGEAALEIVPDDVAMQLNSGQYRQRLEKSKQSSMFFNKTNNIIINSFLSNDNEQQQQLGDDFSTTTRRPSNIRATTPRPSRRKRPRTKAQIDAEMTAASIKAYGMQLCRGRRVGFFGDPLECNRYWFCPASGDNAYPLMCPRGERYNEQTGACDGSLGMSCVLSRDGSSATRAAFLSNANYESTEGLTNIAASDDVGNSATRGDNFNCTDKSGWYGDDNDPDCKRVYFCNAGRATTHTCRGATRYNPKLTRCDVPINVACGVPIGEDAGKKPESSVASLQQEENNKKPILMPFGWARFGVTSKNVSSDISKQIETLAKLQSQTQERLNFATDYDCSGREGYFALRDTGCRQFLYCSNEGNALRFECPGTLLFNNSIALCDWQVRCNEQGQEHARNSAQEESSCRGKPNGFYGESTQFYDRNRKLISDKSRSFYYCSSDGRQRYQYSCPANLVFNQASKVCDWPLAPNQTAVTKANNNIRTPLAQIQAQQQPLVSSSEVTNDGVAGDTGLNAVNQQQAIVDMSNSNEQLVDLNNNNDLTQVTTEMPVLPVENKDNKNMDEQTTPDASVSNDMETVTKKQPSSSSSRASANPTQQQKPASRKPSHTTVSGVGGDTTEHQHQEEDKFDCASRAPGYYAHPQDRTKFVHCISIKSSTIWDGMPSATDEDIHHASQIPMQCPHTGDFQTMFSQQLGQCVFEWQLPPPATNASAKSVVSLAQISALRSSSTANASLLTYLNLVPDNENISSYSNLSNIERRPMDRAVWLEHDMDSDDDENAESSVSAQAANICAGVRSMRQQIMFSDWGSACRRYVVCTAGDSEVRTCAVGEIFDSVRTQRCQANTTAQCFPADTAGGLTMKMPQCEQYPGAWLTDPLSNCTTFYSCDLSASGEAIKFSCPIGMTFNWHIGACDSKNKTDCNSPIDGGMIHVTFSRPAASNQPPMNFPHTSAMMPPPPAYQAAPAATMPHQMHTPQMLAFQNEEPAVVIKIKDHQQQELQGRQTSGRSG